MHQPQCRQRLLQLRRDFAEPAADSCPRLGECCRLPWRGTAPKRQVEHLPFIRDVGGVGGGAGGVRVTWKSLCRNSPLGFSSIWISPRSASANSAAIACSSVGPPFAATTPPSAGLRSSGTAGGGGAAGVP